MTFSYFVYFEDPAHPDCALGAADRSALVDLLRSTPGLVRAHVFTPVAVRTPFSADGPPPVLALQLCFATLPQLEEAIAAKGHLQELALSERWPSLAGTSITHQAMLTRAFAVPHPRDPGAAACSFLVHYPGTATDLNAWLRHYLNEHTRLMAQLPGIRAIEVFTRVDWCDAMPWRRVGHMQRNRIVFDSGDALQAALAAPVLSAMRADFDRFPPFVGGNRHYPMHTTTVAGQAAIG